MSCLVYSERWTSVIVELFCARLPEAGVQCHGWVAEMLLIGVVFSFDLVVSSMYLELADCTKLVHCYLSCCYPLWSVIFRFHTHLH